MTHGTPFLVRGERAPVAPGAGMVLPTGVVGMAIVVFNSGPSVLSIDVRGSEAIAPPKHSPQDAWTQCAS